MAELTKDGITISQDSGTGSAELKLKVANPPYQGFNGKRVEFTIENTDYSVSKTLSANVDGVTVWGWGEDYGNEPIQLGSSVEDLSFSVTGRGNVLKVKQIDPSGSMKVPIYISKMESYSILVKSMKLFIPSIDNENPIITLSDWDGSPTYLSDYGNWPDDEWASQNGDIYEWRIDMELGPNTVFNNKDINLELLSPSYFTGTPLLKVVQPHTEVISLNPNPVTLAADGTESSVQLSTVGAWTVE